MLNWQNLKLIVAVWVSTVFIKKKKKEKRLEMITRIMWKFLSNASHEWKLMKVKFITAVFACEQVLRQGGGARSHSYLVPQRVCSHATAILA